MKKITLLIAAFFYTSFLLFAQEPVTYEEAFPKLTFDFAAEIQNANDGSNRLFVLEQSGKIKVFDNNKNTNTQQVFLDLSSVISFSSGQEIGLLGLAFHPNYKSNGYFYVYYTRRSSLPNISTEMVLARYQVSSNRNIANPSSGFEIFSFDKNMNNSNHNGGKIAFGPDGYLYASIGDGGGSGDPRANAQNLNNIFGSILRIDVDLDGNNPKETNPDLPNGRYEIPRDNPRVGKSGLDELYAWGIRNTWKFSFDKQTNRMWGSDVGQAVLEEINLIQKGGNYGWNRYEGNRNYRTSTSLTTNPDIKPIFTYDHSQGDVSITGGYVYRGRSENKAIKGKYIYGDYASGRVWALNYNGSGNATSNLLFKANNLYVSSFGLDESGEMYFSNYGVGKKLYKIVAGNEPSGPTTVAINGVGSWKELANGTNGIVQAVATQGDNIYVAGSFTNAGGNGANKIAVYNKKQGWKNLSSGANGTVYSLAVAKDGKLYAGGTFTSIGGVSANNIAVWNGSSWSALGSGINGKVAKIGVDGNNNVYAGGAFSTAGGTAVNNIARWNGNWSALRDSGTSAVGTNNEIRAIAIDTDNTLYVGGNFDAAGGRSANRIATWNGSNWGTLGSGTSGFVQAISITSQSVFAGGNFSMAGGKSVNRIARWVKSSKTWQPMGNGLSGNVNATQFDGNYLYAAGSFETAANDGSSNRIVKNIARWSSGQGWQAIGPGTNVGTNNIINSLGLSDNNDRLYVGGNFANAGGIAVKNIGIWSANGFDCSDEFLLPEYQISGTWSSGESTITVDEGTKVVLSLLPNNVGFTITSPKGTVVNGDYNLGSVTESSAGLYTFTTNSGCKTTLNLNVNSVDPCASINVLPEYRINNGEWATGSKVSVGEGDDVVLSIKPDNLDFTINLPDGKTVNKDFSISNISPSQAGVYTFITTEGCAGRLEIEVIEKAIDIDPCDSITIVPEYRINNAVWATGSKISVDEGGDVVLSIRPNNLDFTIRLPDGKTVNNDYTISNILTSQSGVYTFTITDGCTGLLEIEVIEKAEIIEPCSNASVSPEYKIANGNWVTGESRITVDEGTTISLGIKPDNKRFDIVLPNSSVVVGDLTLSNIDPSQAGIYTFTTEDGCSDTFEITIINDGFECTDTSIIPEYNINGVWNSGESKIDIEAGNSLILSMLPNSLDFTILLPNGTEVVDDYSMSDLSSAQSGIYKLTSEDGCSINFEVNVFDNNPCANVEVIPEYQINGIWASGDSSISVDEGSDLTVSILPNDLDFVVTLPDGTKIQQDYRILNLTAADSGAYKFETSAGCTSNLQVNVIETSNCESGEIFNEYRINGIWSSGSSVLNLTEGTNVALSMLPNNIPLTITGPNGEQLKDNVELGWITKEQAGTYTIETGTGCISKLVLNVEDDLDPCATGGIITEYRIDGKWSSGAEVLNIDEGTNVVLSMLPNNVNLTIVTPDGSVVGDNYDLGNMQPTQSGDYTIDSGNGCTKVITINVKDNSVCNENSIAPEYRINGVWDSGKNFLKLEQGTDIMLSILPNSTGLKITLPNGKNVGDNYNLRNVTSEDNGVYVLTTPQGCKRTLELYVSESSSRESGDSKIANIDDLNISIFPNPTVSNITVDLSRLEGKAFNLSITNMSRQKLHSVYYDAKHSNQTTLDFTSYSAGMYFLIFEEWDGTITTKRILKK